MMYILQKLNLAEEEHEVIKTTSSEEERQHIQNTWHLRNEELKTIQMKDTGKWRNRKRHARDLLHHKLDRTA